MVNENPEPEEVESEPAPETAAEETAPAADAAAEDAAPEAEAPAAEEPVAEAAAEEPAAEAAEASAEGEEAAPSAADGLTLGEGAPADDAVDPNFKPVIRGKLDRFGVAQGTGRRKTSVARVRIMDGDGQVSINGRSIEDFFPMERDRAMIMAPLVATDQAGKVNVSVRVNGGGTTGQTGAVVLGVARALQVRDETFHHTLADGGWLTRDGRMVERKKYGLKKARRSFQFSKR